MENDVSSDLDAVLENINLLIGDMENNLNMSSSSSSSLCDDKNEPSSLITSINTTSSDNDSEIMSLLGIPEIKHDLTDSGDNISDTTSHTNNIQKAKETLDLLKRISSQEEILRTRCLKEESRRLYGSTNSSPVQSPRPTAKNSRVEFRERTSSISPRLSMPNIEKFEIEILCPDGQLFKASVFKAWTAFQLAWKIAHVKGMTEKLALVVQEVIADLHLTRPIEDHEIVYTVMQNWAPDSNNKLCLIEEFTKYDLFNEPAEYLPIEILDLKNLPTNVPSSTRSRRSSLLKSIMTADRALDLHGWAYVKSFDENNWLKKYMRLKHSTLYLQEEGNENQVLYSCESTFLYNCSPGFISAHGAPEEYCFCLIPEVVSDWSQIKCFCVSSKRLLTGWASGIRLAKYGQQLYLNFREAMSKEANLRRTNSARQSILFRRSFGENENTKDNKAAIDFSGNNGRVISDPLEALRIQNEIAFEIPKTAKRRSATFAPAVVRKTLLESKVWYHGKMNRDQAVQKLKKHGLKEGLFLVRDSSSSHGNLVLTVITKKGKIAHHQIFQSCTHSGVALYGIEHGPQFSSLELLIESYHSGAVDGADFTLRKPCPAS